MSSFHKTANWNRSLLVTILLGASVCTHVPNVQGIGETDVSHKGIKLNDTFIESLQSSGTFECRSRGELITMKKKYLNDDYCDCEDDGKDEPGTSACSFILEPFRNYYCADDRYMTQEVHSSKVNDGVCDCCDGSDEWLSSDSWKSTSCPHTCINVAVESKERAIKRLDLVRKGYERRQYDLQGPIQESYKNIQLTLDKEKHEIAKLRALKKKVEMYKEHEERVEAQRRLERAEESISDLPEDENKTESSTDSDTREDTPNDLAEEARESPQESHEHNSFEEIDTSVDLEYEESTKLDLDLAPISIPVERSDGTKISLFDYIHEQEQTTETQDEAEGKVWSVGWTVPLNWKFVYLIILRTSGLLFSPIRALVEFVLFLPSIILDLLVELELIEDPNQSILAAQSAHLEALIFRYFGRGFAYRFYRDFIWSVRVFWDSPIWLYNYHFPESEAIPKSPEAESLRQILQHIDQKMDHHERVYQSHQKAYTQDFGPQREFSLLRNGCLKSHVGGYTYKFCAFQEVLQDHVNMGYFKNWDQSGDADSQYTKMLFGGGAKCWNGPERSTIVHLICGTTEEIVSVDEPRTCEYEMVVSTHAACTDKILNKAQKEFDFWQEKV